MHGMAGISGIIYRRSHFREKKKNQQNQQKNPPKLLKVGFEFWIGNSKEQERQMCTITSWGMTILAYIG